jgi:hypothetical protein
LKLTKTSLTRLKFHLLNRSDNLFRCNGHEALRTKPETFDMGISIADYSQFTIQDLTPSSYGFGIYIPSFYSVKFQPI